MTIQAYAASEPSGPLEPFAYDPGPLDSEAVEITVEACGICHSDLSMLDNEWGMSQYPLVPGHEVVGRVTRVGDAVKSLQVEQRVGLGWYSRSCMTCEYCMSGDHNLCLTAEATMLGRYGGFADKVHCHYSWAIPLPETLNPLTAGPLFCGGITVFNPIVQLGVQPTDRVGVIGIGGLGHMALQFLAAWGCEVTAFTSSQNKAEQARSLGAHHVVNSRDVGAIAAVANTFDLILSTVNADLDWNTYLAALRPKGHLHLVGVVTNPLSIQLFPLLAGQKSVSGSPLGSPVTIQRMLKFAARHQIEPMTEVFPFAQINEAIAHLRSGNARYRIVLQH